MTLRIITEGNDLPSSTSPLMDAWMACKGVDYPSLQMITVRVRGEIEARSPYPLMESLADRLVYGETLL